ncbi:hypothetical protein [Cupriavidus sp. TMH.W2]|uniref:hypothetical protein n=1 Tax=Cupriavidus sp. TMH.W2 TaxID=3434465 RepID=UPI003D77C9C0
MRKLFFALLVAVGLSACSEKPTLYTATTMFGGREIGVTAKMTLNNFNDKTKEGDGNIEVTKAPGSAWAGKEGSFPITWKAMGTDTFIVVVPSVNDAFMMDVNPMNQSMLGIGVKKSYWCRDCEELRNGVGLGILPGLFVKSN